MKKYLIILIAFLFMFIFGVPAFAADYVGTFTANPTILSYSAPTEVVRRNDGKVLALIEGSTDCENYGSYLYLVNPNNSYQLLAINDIKSNIAVRSDGVAVLSSTSNKIILVAPDNSISYINASSSYNIVAASGTTTTLIERNYSRFKLLYSNNTFSSSYTWVHGTSYYILGATGRPNGNIVMVGIGGKWAVYNGTSLIASGTLPSGTSARVAVARSDNTVLLCDYNGNVYQLDASNNITSLGNCGISSYIAYGTKFDNDTVLLSNNSNSSRFVLPNNTFGAQLGRGGAIAALSDNSIISIDYGSGTFYHSYFTPDSAPTFSNFSQNGMTINWVQTTPGQYTFRVERSTDGTNFTEIAQTSSASYTDSGLSPGTRYYYRVRVSTPNIYYPYSPVGNARTIPPNPTTLNGTGSGLSWSATAGRGKVVLSWPAVTGATGYKVWVFDGNAYRSFDVGNVTSWDSSIAKIYPDETWLNQQANNSVSTDPFNHSGGGFDLRDDPNKLYLKTIGTTYDNSHNYWFKLSAYNESGESGLISSAYTVTLPNRTDTTAPSGSFSVTVPNGVMEGPCTLTLTLSMTDSESGVYQMRFSNDGSSYSSWEAYNTTKQWTSPSGSGQKTVYTQVKDNVGNTATFSCGYTIGATINDAYNAANAAQSASVAAQTAAANAATTATAAKTSADSAYGAASAAVDNTFYNGQSAAYWAYQAAQNTVPPTITKVQGLNGATCTTGSTFTVVISATPSSGINYRVTCGSFDSGWLSNNTITINSGITSGANTATVQVKNSTGSTAQTTFTFFKV